MFIHSAFLAIPMAPVVTISEQDMTKYFSSNTFLTQRLIKLIHPLLKVQKTSVAVFIQDKTKKNHKKFLGIHNAIQPSKSCDLEETKRTGPKVLMFEPLSMPTKTRNIMFPGEDKKKLSTCEEEANKLVRIILSEIGY